MLCLSAMTVTREIVVPVEPKDVKSLDTRFSE